MRARRAAALSRCERREGAIDLALPRALAEWREGFGRAELAPLRCEWAVPARLQASNEKRAASALRPRS